MKKQKIFVTTTFLLSFIVILTACDDGSPVTATSALISATTASSTTAPATSAATAVATTVSAVANTTTAAANSVATTAVPPTPTRRPVTPRPTATPRPTIAIVPGQPINNWTRAVQVVSTQINKDNLYAGRVPANCFSLALDKEDPAFYEIVTLEKHGDECPGDPATAPVLDRFRVYRDNGRLEGYDLKTDKYLPYDQFKAAIGK